MVAHEGVPLFAQAKSVLEVSATSEHWLNKGHSHGDGLRRIPARTADDSLPTSNDTHDGIIAAHVNRPVVQQENICDRAESFKGFGIVERDGLVAHITAGHNQRQTTLVEQQVVQRRVWQHYAEATLARCHLRGDWVGFALTQQNDRPLVRENETFFRRINTRDLPNSIEIERHEGEGFIFALFALTQAADSFVVARAASEVIAAQSFDCQNLASFEEAGGENKSFIAKSFGLAGSF